MKKVYIALHLLYIGGWFEGQEIAISLHGAVGMLKNDVGRLVWPLFLCPGGESCRYWTVRAPALFREAAKMILTALRARFCPRSSDVQMMVPGLFLVRFRPFPASWQTRANKATGKAGAAPPKTLKNGLVKLPSGGL